METFDVRLHAGGYWTEDCIYLGGNTHIIRVDSQSLKMIDFRNMVIKEGYSENMDTFSYFPLGVEGLERKLLRDDNDVAEMVSCLGGVKDVYAVRSDDPNFEGFRTADLVDSSTDDSENENPYIEDNESENEEHGVEYVSDNELEGETIKFHVGQIFESKGSFKKAIDSYAIRGKLNIGYKRSESKKVTATCVEEDCPWRIYASINSSSNGKFVVRTFDDKHSCSWSGKVRLYTARKMADTFFNEFRIEPLKTRVIKARMEAGRIKTSKDKCQRAREHCRQLVEDEHVEQFRRMFDYVIELRESNPGSTIVLGTQAQVFEKLYACFYAQKFGWKKACRRIIHLDGTHLKGRMKGQMLSAIGRDANDGLYPIAWAIVSVENKLNWQWFLKLLRDDLELGSGNGSTIMSDQQKGLIGAINLVCPDIEHRMCARHIWGNIRKKHGETPLLNELFWKVARAYNTREFDSRLVELKILRPDVEASVQRYARHWSRAYFQDCIKSDVVENNHSESFNNVISLERYKHVFVLLEFVRRYVMTSNKEKLDEIQKYRGSLPPRIKAELDLRKRKSYDCQYFSSGRGRYEIDHFKSRYSVNVRGNISCSCRQYEVSGIPCPHIIKALSEDDKTKKPESFVSSFLTTTKWEECYEECIQPVNGINMWKRCKDVEVLPPADRIPKGRPPGNKRILESWERAPKQSKKPKLVMTCSRCGGTGHNIRTCKNKATPTPETELASKRGRGRPKKSVSNQEEISQPYLQSQPNVAVESHGVFHSSFTGEDYVCSGRRVIDTSTNMVLPSTMFRQHERSKMAARRNAS